jgi:gliding motility-associated-like protein
VEEKDYIKEVFQNRFSDFEAEVDPQMWDSIQSSMHTPVAQSTVSSGFSGLAITGMIVASLSILLGTGYFLWTSQDSKVPNSELKTEIEQPIESTSSTEILVPETEIQLDQPAEAEAESDIQLAQESKTQMKPVKEFSTPPNQESGSRIKSTGSPTNEVPNSDLETEKIEVPTTTPSHVNMADISSVIASPVGGEAPLEVQFSTLANAKTIKWDFDDGVVENGNAPQHTYTMPGVYFVTMIAELETGEIIMDKAVIEVKQARQAPPEIETAVIRIPNVFTPNGDGIHDVLEMECQNLESFSMSIYSVNGSLVFQTENPEIFWDGKDRNGNAVEDGTYYYLVNAVGLDRKNYAPKGYITLRR